MKLVCSGMFKSDGKPVFCVCGKQAVSSIIGKEAYIAWCED